MKQFFGAFSGAFLAVALLAGVYCGWCPHAKNHNRCQAKSQYVCCCKDCKCKDCKCKDCKCKDCCCKKGKCKVKKDCCDKDCCPKPVLKECKP